MLYSCPIKKAFAKDTKEKSDDLINKAQSILDNKTQAKTDKVDKKNLSRSPKKRSRKTVARKTA
ncbi:hypothetical protein [Borrelia persica]|uniref:hypothetical protein n=1 Tax=Borrelia persica TaxID=44448 RepID=UPI0004BC52A1|nr:hypothetical protein [Borrelia persica]